jgi:hypothetical protein
VKCGYVTGNIKKKADNRMDHTDEYIKEILEKIDSKKGYYAEISNKIWEFAEPRFQEYRSSELLQHVLKQAGFSIKADLAGEKTAFIAEYGSGKPVIAFLGEFDALPGLSQKADVAERIPANTGSCGHGCGHQLIGTGTLASVIALKDFVKEHNLQGTIRYYGCPAEENAGGMRMEQKVIYNGQVLTLTQFWATGEPCLWITNPQQIGIPKMEVPRQISEYFLHFTELRPMHPCALNWGVLRWMR